MQIFPLFATTERLAKAVQYGAGLVGLFLKEAEALKMIRF